MPVRRHSFLWDVFQEEKLQAHQAPDQHAEMQYLNAMQLKRATISEVDSRISTTGDSRMYGSSYSGVYFASSFDPDNIAVDRHPVYSG